MNLVPYTGETLLSMLARYNEFFWPLQMIAFVLLGCAVGVLLKKDAHLLKALMIATGLCWIFCALFYFNHWLYELTWAAKWLAMGFAAQGLALVACAFIGRAHPISPSPLSWSLLVLAALYPLISLLGPYETASLAILGLAPLPTVIFTFAVLSLYSAKTKLLLGVLPLLWAGFAVLETIELEFWTDLSLGLGVGLWALTLLKPHKTA